MSEAPLLNALNIILGEKRLKLLTWVINEGLSLNDCWLNLAELTKEDDIEAKKAHFSIDQEYAKLEERNIRLVTRNDAEYPSYLNEIPFPPLGLYLQGLPLPSNFNLNLAIVGTRKLSAYGESIIKKFVPDLVRNHINIISGLALGADSCAHRETLKTAGYTIAVLGSGLNCIAPLTNISLAKQVSAQGTLVSEFPLETPPLAHHFPLRNRIISGLSRAVLVIEAPLKSGSLITAKYGLDQNRDILAVPGSVFDINATGTNNLISRGAKLISKVEDVLEVFGIDNSQPLSNYSDLKLSSDEKVVLEIIRSNDSCHVDKIAALAKLRPACVLAATTLLELKGLISGNGNGYFHLNTR
ncbi:MAG TPA: DNA-processing protein DprA [Candidatus Paceibacterota bacterium]|nr:DNA-processing protein DprA [Candidatus Paceibacterota bacterium]